MRVAIKRFLWENIAELSMEVEDGNASSRNPARLLIPLQAALYQTELHLLQQLYPEPATERRPENDEPRGSHLLLG